jgi:hypothetical protein
MDSMNDIKQIWLSTDTTKLPKADELLRTVRRYRLIFILKSIAFGLLILILTATMVHVLINYKSQLPSTRVGEGLMITALLILWSVSFKSLRRIPVRGNYTNKQFIEYLKKEQQIHAGFQKRTQGIGFIIASSGLLFYLYEGIYLFAGQLIIGYSLALLWILGCWIILRPRMIKRMNKRLSDTIGKLEKLSSQLSNE